MTKNDNQALNIFDNCWSSTHEKKVFSVLM